MNLDLQSLVLTVLGIATTTLGWFARELYTAVTDLRKDLSDLRVLMAHDYVSYDRLAELLGPIARGVEEIKVSLAHKVDK